MRRVSDLLHSLVDGRPMLQRILSNISWLFLDKIVRLGLGLVVGVWVARYLGPENYGLLNYAAALVTLFAILVQLGLQSVVVRDLVNDPAGTNETIGTAMVLQLVSALVAYSLLTLAIGFLRPEDLLARSIVALLGLTLFMSALDTSRYWFEAQVMSKYIIWLSIIVFVVLSAVRVALIMLEASVITFAVATVVDAFVVGTGVMLLFFRFGPNARELRFSLGRARRLISDSWPLFLAGAAIVVYMKIDMLMLGQMASDEAVGIYSAATKISELWYFIPMIVVTSVFPSILRAKKQDEALYYRRLQQLFDLMLWMSVLVALPMTFLSTPIIRLLFGEAFAAAGPVLAIHIWAAVFVFLGLASGKWFIAEGRQLLSLQRALAGAFANVALNLVLIPQYGALGAAWATLISYGISAFLFDLFQHATRRLFFMKLATLSPLAAVRRIMNLI